MTGRVPARAIGRPVGRAPAQVKGVGWWDASAVLDMDFANGRFRWNGVSYSDETAFLAAIGGSKSGITRTIGPYVAPDATELVVNGDFASDVSSWAAAQSLGGPASIAFDGGELALTGASADSPVARQQITTAPGRAYQARAKVRRGTGNTTQAPKLAITSSSNGALNGAQHYGQGLNNGSNVFAEQIRNFAMHGTSAYVGLRALFNPATQVYNLDDVSVKECSPFQGFTPGEVSGVIRGVTPAVASGNKVVWQLDADMVTEAILIERNYLRLVWDASEHLRLIASYQTATNVTSEQANLDLGVVSPLTPFVLAFSATANAFSASLDGQPAVTDVSGLFPGCAVMRICRSQSGDTWDGAINRVTLF